VRLPSTERKEPWECVAPMRNARKSRTRRCRSSTSNWTHWRVRGTATGPCGRPRGGALREGVRDVPIGPSEICVQKAYRVGVTRRVAVARSPAEERTQKNMQLPHDGLSGPLRPGPRRLPREDVLAIQRDRLLAAAVTVVSEVGHARWTVGRIVDSSRVSRNTFYGIFQDCEDCFRAAFEALVDHARGRVRSAYTRESSWREGIRAAVVELLSLMDEEPGPAKLCVVDALAGGESVIEARARVLEELAVVVDRGREGIADGHVLPALAAESVVAGAVGVIHAHLVEGREDPLASLAGPLTYMIVVPYAGVEEAASELSSAPCGAARMRPSSSNGLGSPLEGLSMRLTYRTVKVLDAISRCPGASNREVAAEAGVLDQGQISKLLHRLRGLGLIENGVLGGARATANSWHLTRRGAEVVRMTRPGNPSVVGRMVH
jgi:AcrR family transcriptional regulator